MIVLKIVRFSGYDSYLFFLLKHLYKLPVFTGIYGNKAVTTS